MAQAKAQLKERPPEGDELAKTWKARVDRASKKMKKFHQRVKHNRKLVAGFDWDKDPDSSDFYMHRANLIHGTITAILPNIYARNPEMSVTANHQGRDLKLLCKTLEKVTNRQLTDAKLKKRAKATVRAALTVSIGAVKVMYQRDINEDPIIKGRIQDAQDNIKNIEGLLLKLEDPQACADQNAAKAELEETLEALQEQVEVVAAEGMVVDRLLTEHILIDDTVAEFEDYADGDFMVHLIPMRKSTAEGNFGYKLDGATAYREAGEKDSLSFMREGSTGSGDQQICIMEIWDKRSQRVFTTAQGLDFWIKDPFSPKCVGERWYPFFLLPFQLVDGQVVGPSLVDLCEKLQKEHNDTRDKEVAHRDLIKPGWVASSDVNEKSIKRYQDSVLGEITILDSEGKPIQNMIMAKNHPPIDPAAYDTSKVRFDWEQVSGMQDAARSTVVSAKTATEANIMQQSLSGRVSEFRDQVEDFLQDISQYTAQILLQELTPQQVERIMGPHKIGPMIDQATGQPSPDPATGQPIMVVTEPAYDWPQLSRDEVFDLVQLQIRSGTTGEPDKIEQQETWIKLMPVIQPLIIQIMTFQLKGIDCTALIALLKETVARFDDKLDIEQLIPNLQPLPPPPPVPGAAPGQSTNLQAVA